jgi:hypothetical protein
MLRHNKPPMRRLSPACLVTAIALLLAGCGESRFDPSKLYKGMDRSTIVAQYGSPDGRKRHDDVERLTYKDGEHYQYLLMLVDGKLKYWHHDRVYKANRFSNIRNWEASEQQDNAR